MKTRNRRQRQQLLSAAILGVIALVNLLFFFILYTPARNNYTRLQTSIAQLQEQIRTRQATADRLETVGTQLQDSERDRSQLYMSRFLHRDAGFSEILPELDAMAIRTGVRKTRVDYAISPIPQYGLYSVKIRLPVQGTYSNVVRFVEELERSSTFFIIEGIDLRGSQDTTEPSGATAIALQLGLETFFYQ